jgi:hypothetical protein
MMGGGGSKKHTPPLHRPACKNIPGGIFPQMFFEFPGLKLGVKELELLTK